MGNGGSIMQTWIEKKKKSEPVSDIERLEKVLSNHEFMKGCYFWRVPNSASQRRQLEEDRSGKLEVPTPEGKLMVKQETTVSCRNVYYDLRVELDGARKDVRAIKKALTSLRRTADFWS